MLDPLKNAKAVGVILIIIGLLDFRLSGNILVLSLPVSSLAVGYALYNGKLWGVYGLGAILVLKAVLTLWAMSLGTDVGVSTAVVLIIYSILFVWFYFGKKKFSK